MKISITMKDPDCLYESIQEAVKGSIPAGTDETEAEMLVEHRCEKLREMLVAKWFEYGEYLTVEIDTEAQTATVIPRK